MYLGLDIGTSSIKGLLQNYDGKIIASHNVNLSVSRPKEGYSEQNPQDWIEATKTVILAIKNIAGSKLKQLLAIGLSGQMHGLVSKFNIGTELRQVFGSTLRETLDKEPDMFDRLKILKTIQTPLCDATRRIITNLK